MVFFFQAREHHLPCVLSEICQDAQLAVIISMFETCFIVNFEDASEGEIYKLLEFLDIDKNFIKDKSKDFLAKVLPKAVGKTLIKYISCCALNIKLDDIKMEKGPKGKPFLKGFSGFHFNISHTNWAVIIFISKSCVGVDAERIREINLKISNKFFCSQEKEFVLRSCDKTSAFFEVWTRKEAYTKYLGTGIFDTFASVNILDLKNTCKIKTFRSKELFISICKGEDFEFNVVELSAADMCRIFENFRHELKKSHIYMDFKRKNKDFN